MVQFIENYAEIIELATQFIRDEISNSHTKGVVIGLSGGIDSAIIAYLASNALGKDKVALVHLPEEELDIIHTNDAQSIADDLDILLRTINISPMLNGAFQLLPDVEDNPLAKGNLKARIRAIILYSIANLENRLVVGTSNKSEISIGYGTKFGDLAADIWPIGQLYKTEVYEIARKLGVNDKIITKPPTAGLWKGQTDEKEIGISYEKLDRFLIGLESNGIEEVLIKELQLVKEQSIRIKKLIENSQHKRRMPKTLQIKRK
ncbi:MAG: NAD+ synthase [Candidatus Heimdallarchaeota archaeon]|nr:NAD+ synthase [Candidatus Heimdallarchaeota archaeon]